MMLLAELPEEESLGPSKTQTYSSLKHFYPEPFRDITPADLVGLSRFERHQLDENEWVSQLKS